MHVQRHQRPRRDAPTAPPAARAAAFTLVELLVVIGIIAILIGILVPTVTGARRQANTAACLANLRSIGQGWHIYISENRQSLPHLFWYAGGANPDLHWHGFWGGILAQQGMPVWKMLCPQASDPMPGNISGGFGAAFHAWSGQHNTAGTVIRYPGSPLKQWSTRDPVPGAYRVGTYGFNNHTASPSVYGNPVQGTGRWGRKITNIRNPWAVPLFVDSVWPHVEVYNWANQTETSSPPPPGQHVLIPPDLYGRAAWQSGGRQHWRFLLARHKRGVNLLTMDGAARWAPLEEIYLYQWDNDPAQQSQSLRGWTPYKLVGLPAQ